MADHGGTLRVVVPAASPSRRDYQLRSCRDEESSRPQSPWLPRGDESTTMSPFRLYESAVIDRPNSRSGPVPSPSYRRQLVQSGSFAGRLPSEEWNDRRVSSSPTSWRRNCVSGELGRSFELAKARGSKSGEIVGLEIRADGIFPIPESSSRARDPSVRKHSSPKLEGVRKHSSPSGSILWEALNDADNVVSPRRERVVPVPFKWEQTSSSSPSYSRISSDRCSSAKISKAELDVGSSAVPFKWEVRPGKPKELEVSEKTIPPALQLPPRLSSMKQRASSAPRYRSLSASLSSKLEEPPSPSSTSSPRRPSRHLSQFGTPQYQSADSYNFCCDSDRARSPTSTLCGPGTPSSSSSTSSSYSRKPSSISFSQNSGTSLESFDRWDHVSPTSRHSYAESQDSNSRDDRDANVADGAIVKLRRKLKSSKPPRSPMRAPSGEEFFDCQQALASSPRIPRREDEPATRLPYKMPPSPARDFEPLPESPTRGEFAHCLALPRFLSKPETAAVQWLQNPSWDSTAAPSRDLEDGYRSPAYKATLELLSPSPDLMSQKSRSSSSRRRHSHLVEVLCNSLKQSLQRCTKRSVARTHSIVLYDDQFTKRHQSFMW